MFITEESINNDNDVAAAPQLINISCANGRAPLYTVHCEETRHGHTYTHLTTEHRLLQGYADVRPVSLPRFAYWAGSPCYSLVLVA